MIDIFAELDKEFHFTLDAAADASNAKCLKYFTEEDDALTQDWEKHRVWLNPPGAEDPTPWVMKAVEAAVFGGATVVALLRPGLNTPWFHLAAKVGEVRYITAEEFLCAECGQHLEFCVVIFRAKA